MEIYKKKCSLKEHSDINANIYCKKCDIYICNKCEVYHSKLFESHKNYILSSNINEINDEFCGEENHHNYELKYYCKDHNILCCAACIAKIKTKGDGQHMNCEVCCIEDIKEEKISKIKKNIILLEELSSNFGESFKEIKKIYDQINENKENLKIKIQKIFTKLRNILNNREDELLDNIDKENEKIYFKNIFVRDIEKLPDKIKSSLEKCKAFDENIITKNENIHKLLKDCTEIENNINTINKIKSNINNIHNFANTQIKFIPEENQMDEFIKSIKTFGTIIIEKIEIDNIFKYSNILKNDIDNIKLIAKWIEETTNKYEIKFELIFKMSQNGTKSEDFHKYCDNQGPTLILVKTTTNRIFGGYTPLNWQRKEGSFKDLSLQTFIFSLNLKKKYNMIKSNVDAIVCSYYNGPNFGASDFRLTQNLKNGLTYANEGCSFLSNKNLELTGTKGDHENFVTEEFEVYKVINN